MAPSLRLDFIKWFPSIRPMNSIEFRPSEYEFKRPQPMVQLSRDLIPSFEAEAHHQKYVQRWSTLDLWRRLCRVLLIRESSPCHPNSLAIQHAIVVHFPSSQQLCSSPVPSIRKPIPPSTLTSSSSLRSLREPLIRELPLHTIWMGNFNP